MALGLASVQTSLTLLSLLLRFSRFFLIVLPSRRLSVVSARNGYACINRACLKPTDKCSQEHAVQTRVLLVLVHATQEFTGDPIFTAIMHDSQKVWFTPERRGGDEVIRMLQLYIVCKRGRVSPNATYTRTTCWNREHKWLDLRRNSVWRTKVRHTLRHTLRHAYEPRPLLFTKVWRTRRRKTNFCVSRPSGKPFCHKGFQVSEVKKNESRQRWAPWKGRKPPAQGRALGISVTHHFAPWKGKSIPFRGELKSISHRL